MPLEAKLGGSRYSLDNAANPGADNGAPRSETNARATWGFPAGAAQGRAPARSGRELGVAPSACRDAVLQSIFGQTFKENTHATFTAARVKNVAA